MIKFDWPQTDIVEVEYLIPARLHPANIGMYREEFKLIAGRRVNVGDVVVIETQTGLYAVGRVRTIDIQSEERNFGYVVDVVNLQGLKEFKEREAQKAALKKALIQRKQEIEDMLIIETLAERDEDFKKMLSTFKELGGTL